MSQIPHRVKGKKNSVTYSIHLKSHFPLVWRREEVWQTDSDYRTSWGAEINVLLCLKDRLNGNKIIRWGFCFSSLWFDLGQYALSAVTNSAFTGWQCQLQMLSHNVFHFQSHTAITAPNATASCYYCVNLTTISVAYFRSCTVLVWHYLISSFKAGLCSFAAWLHAVNENAKALLWTPQQGEGQGGFPRGFCQGHHPQFSFGSTCYV